MALMLSFLLRKSSARLGKVPTVKRMEKKNHTQKQVPDMLLPACLPEIFYYRLKYSAPQVAQMLVLLHADKRESTTAARVRERNAGRPEKCGPPREGRPEKPREGRPEKCACINRRAERCTRINIEIEKYTCISINMPACCRCPRGILRFRGVEEVEWEKAVVVRSLWYLAVILASRGLESRSRWWWCRWSP
jgi:hypothetical protein